MKTKILFWGTFALCIIMAVYFSVRITQGLMGHRNVTDVDKITLTFDSGKMDANAISSAIGVTAGTPSYSIRLGDILDRIMAIPDIEAASVRRTPRGNLHIRVRVKTAIATWTDGVVFMPLTSDGSLINRPGDAAPKGAIVFMGAIPKDIAGIVAVMNKYPNVSAETDRMEWIEGRRWNIHTKTNITVKLPETHWDAAIAELSGMIKKTDILSRELKVLDMRDQARTLVEI